MNRSQTALLHAKEPQDSAFCASPVLPTTQLAENRLEAVREAVDAILLNCPDPLQVRDGAVHLYGVAQACALIALRRGEDAELAAIAGMLHDLSTYADTYTPDHAAHAAAPARPLLPRGGRPGLRRHRLPQRKGAGPHGLCRGAPGRGRAAARAVQPHALSPGGRGRALPRPAAGVLPRPLSERRIRERKTAPRCASFFVRKGVRPSPRRSCRCRAGSTCPSFRSARRACRAR